MLETSKKINPWLPFCLVALHEQNVPKLHHCSIARVSLSVSVLCLCVWVCLFGCVRVCMCVCECSSQSIWLNVWIMQLKMGWQICFKCYIETQTDRQTDRQTDWRINITHTYTHSIRRTDTLTMETDRYTGECQAITDEIDLKCEWAWHGGKELAWPGCVDWALWRFARRNFDCIQGMGFPFSCASPKSEVHPLRCGWARRKTSEEDSCRN